MSRLLRRLREHDPFYIELFSGMTAIGWGVYLLMSGETLRSIPSYDPISRYLPDTIWVSWAMLAGAVQLVSALIGFRSGRIAASFALMIFYKIIAVSIFRSPEPGPGWVIACGWALANVATTGHGLFVRRERNG